MISEELFYSLKVGDKIKIVDKWPERNIARDVRSMDEWLGKIVTVRKIAVTDIQGNPQYLKINEDQKCNDGWYWNRYTIEKVMYPVNAIGLEELI